MRLLYLIPALGPSGASSQLEILAYSLNPADHQVVVCQLGSESAASIRLAQAGIRVHSLDWTRSFDPLPLWRLHGILRNTRPELIHVWGRTALRTLALVGRNHLGRVVLSQPFAWDQRSPMSAVDRWLFRRVARIVVHGEAEAKLGKEQGLYLEKIAVIPPGIAAEEPAAVNGDDWQGWPRKIVCLGPLERHKGFRNAVWAFDFLRFVFEDLHLVFVGAGTDRETLARIAANLCRGDSTHFMEPQGAAAACLAQADVCWIPSLRGGGTQAALEAMRAGRAVVACQVPSLQGLIVDGQSGFYVPPDDKVAIARRTWQILTNPGLARELGRQAQQRVRQLFPARLLVERCQRTYLEVAA